MATTIQRFCLDLTLSCGKRNQFLSNSSSSAPSNFITFNSPSFPATLSLTLSFVPNVKGLLPQRALERSIRYGSVICMAKRYAPDTTKRKRLSRKRGGDPAKKKKTRRKGGRKDFKIVRLSSTARTGFFYAKKKSRKMADKIEVQKYDPIANRHVLFTEVKMLTGFMKPLLASHFEFKAES
ncbi:50S ribosomal protein L33-like [Cucumis melo var. makuwa]|uniref:Large ribosomal subunit protein bL33c n=1 Tax=Cucumis melo var. makuwa TaxID=1194695 RepID=A0A5A7UZ21_CUCMM|nr:50S ribosomal protein L33-like [Cucumis melo var. makuwa]TYK11245.1 50S ribosomal protein L33-like [Cucumis melo var. makuwa]